MYDIYAADGSRIGAIPLSPMLHGQVEAGKTVEIHFHMPKMLKALGRMHADGTFSVTKGPGGKYVTDDVASCSAYADIQAVVEVAEVKSRADAAIAIAAVRREAERGR
jgi:hypothetical protein